MKKLTLLVAFFLSWTWVMAAGPDLELRYVQEKDTQKKTYIHKGVSYPLMISKERAIGYYKSMYANSTEKKVIIYVISDEAKDTEIIKP